MLESYNASKDFIMKVCNL